MADVETLDALRHFIEFKQITQGLEPVQQGLPAGQTCSQRRRRVGHRHIEEACAITADGSFQFDLVPRMGAERLGEHVNAFRRMAEDQLDRNRALKIVLTKEGLDHRRLIGIEGEAREEIARTEADAFAEKHHTDAGDAVGDGAGEDIHVTPCPLHVVIGLHFPDQGDAIANHRRALEIKLGAGPLHLCNQFIEQGIALAFEKQDRVAYAGLVILDRDQVHARRTAAADLILQAGP